MATDTYNMDNTFITTYMGKKYWPLEPKVEDVCIEDIAHALSLKCRFGGHCREFYSIAQHSIEVCDSFFPSGLIKLQDQVKLKLVALLHDAAEAYLCDVCSPIKPHIQGFEELENKNLKVIFEKFDLPFEGFYSEQLKGIDLMVLATEMRDLARTPNEILRNLPRPLDERIYGWSPYVAERRFLKAFHGFYDLFKRVHF